MKLASFRRYNWTEPSGSAVPQIRRDDPYRHLAQCLFDGAEDALLLLDTEAKILAANAAWIDLTGHGRDLLIDRSIYAERGVALSGPPASEVFVPATRGDLLPLVVESLEWHAPGSARGADVVLNAARSLHYALEGTWSSKDEAGRWALEQLGPDDAVVQALAARNHGGDVEPDEAERFRLGVLARLRMLG